MNDYVLVAKTGPSHDRINRLTQIIKTNHPNSVEKESLIELISDYSDLFHIEGDYLTSTNIVTYNINTLRLTKPIYIRPYRLPWTYLEEIEKQISEMKRNDIIQNSTSPFNFPLVDVKKKNTDKDGKPKLRICVDFRRFNDVSEPEAYGLPNLLEVLESLGSSKYFPTLDLPPN